MIYSYVALTVVRFINLESRMPFQEIGEMEDATSSTAPGMVLTEVVSK